MSAAFPREIGPIWLVGCGNMAGAMLRRWLDAGADPAQFTIIKPTDRNVPPGVRWSVTVPDEALPAVVLLGVKPQMLDAVAGETAAKLKGVPLLISILAGAEIAALAERFDAQAIVRAMPNLPVAIGKGVVALEAEDLPPETAATVEALMAPLGYVSWVEAAQFQAITALEGCGPAFLFRFTDALAQAGAALGIPADEAARLAMATVEGAAMMAAASADSPAVLADRVASPGGSTREGLNVLDRDDALVRLLTETLTASERRGREMADAAKR